MDNNKIQSFENKKVRSIWDAEKEEWFFSVVDVVAILTDSPNPQVYWIILNSTYMRGLKNILTSAKFL